MPEVKMNETAWGNIIFRIADATETGEMPASLEQLGKIKENSISIDPQRGTKLQLKETGGGVHDQTEGEPVVTIGMTIIGIPVAMREMFWQTENKGEKTRVKSLVTNKKFAIEILNPKVPGSDTLEIPKTSVFMGMLLADDEGYTAPLEITILKSEADAFFDMGVVGAETE